MATYAAYRHIELDKVGYGKKRVLKPPGGGSSDIFGTTSSGQENNTRRVKNHMASSVFLNDDPATNNTSAGGATATPAKQSGNDSFCRLFGPPSPPTKSAVKPKTNIFQSNVLQVAKDGDSATNENNGNTEHMNGDNIDSAGHDEPVVNGNSSTPVTNGNRTMNGTSNAARARVPPGGFSSGLW